jgi:lysine 6-dehydrogenase
MVLRNNHAPRFVVLGGAGAIGRTVARDLFESGPGNHIVISDFNGDAAKATAENYRSRRVTWSRADARDPADLMATLADCSAVVNCTRHQLNLTVMQAALNSRVHYLDLGGLFIWTRRQLRLNRLFADAGITAIIGMGCAPGLTNVMAAAAATAFERVHSVRIRIAGIDFNEQRDPFTFPYSPATIIQELTLPPWKWSRGRFVKARPRSGWERVAFDPPIGEAWVVLTRHSEIATLPSRLKAKGLRYADFKVSFDRNFVKELMRRLRSGCAVHDFDTVAGARNSVNDYEVARVIVSGRLPGQREIRTMIMDCCARSRMEWHASAGDMDTACPASIVAQMLTSGVIDQPGVWAPEDVVPPQALFEQMRRRRMEIRQQKGPRGQWFSP